MAYSHRSLVASFHTDPALYRIQVATPSAYLLLQRAHCIQRTRSAVPDPEVHLGEACVIAMGGHVPNTLQTRVVSDIDWPTSRRVTARVEKYEEFSITSIPRRTATRPAACLEAERGCTARHAPTTDHATTTDSRMHVMASVASGASMGCGGCLVLFCLSWLRRRRSAFSGRRAEAGRRRGNHKPQPQLQPPPLAALRPHRHRQDKVRRSRNGNRQQTNTKDENNRPMQDTRQAPANARRRQSQLSPHSVGEATDGFDAPTTEAHTDWNTTGIDGVEGRDYSVSVSGYRNYVNEMERMLGGEVDVRLDGAPTPRHSAENSRRRDREVRYPPESVHETDTSVAGRRPGLGSYASMDNVRHVSGRKGRVELVEHKIMEDGPERTISLWRERVAQSGDGSSRYGDESNRAESAFNRGHRRVVSAEVYHGNRQEARYPGGGRAPERPSTSFVPSKSRDVSRESNGGYERTEVSSRPSLFGDVWPY